MVRVHVAGDDGGCADVLGEIAQERVPLRVTALERALELDVEAVAEGPREPHGDVRVAHAEPVARAAGEADEALVRLREKRRIERGRHRLGGLRPRARVSGREQAAEVRVPRRRLGQQRHVRPTDESDLGAGDRPHAEVLRRLGELERAVDAVMVGESERLVAELGRAQRELLGMGGAVEERIG
jgi:hypothetical protein